MNKQPKNIRSIHEHGFGTALVALFVSVAALTFFSRSDAHEKLEFSSDITTVISGPPQSVAFTSNRDGNNEIYVMNPDGMMQTRVTISASNDQRPDISPDGSKIVFASNRITGHFEIFIMNFNGSGATQLTSLGSSTTNCSWPRWSPDGEWIAFQCGAGSNFQIYRIRPDGSDLTQITNYAGLNQFPAWSPDGTRLAIRRDTEIYVIDSSDGGNPVRLTFTDSVPGTFNQMAAFSPDGSKLAFLSVRDRTSSGALYPSVFIMDSDGQNQINFTPKPTDYAGTWTSRAPSWSPNGEFIYFTGVRSLSDTGGVEEIFVKPVGAGDETKLTAAGANVEASVRIVHPPTITNVAATPNVLWPPKNQFVSVTLSVDVTDNSDPAPVCAVTNVTSSEELLEPGWEITGPLTLDLLAQRYGVFDGRIYTISVTCMNTSQLSSTATVTVTVPHDRGRRPLGLSIE